MLKLAWEPARFIAFTTWNANMDRKGRLKKEQDLRRFPWERRDITRDDYLKAKKDAERIRRIAKNKWGLKYYGE